MTKKRSLYVLNELFESFFNAAFVNAVVVQRSLVIILESLNQTISKNRASLGVGTL